MTADCEHHVAISAEDAGNLSRYLVPTRQRGNAVSTAPAVLDAALATVVLPYHLIYC
jgi:hypothetical protein